jgi:hypothetical protein
MVAAIIILLCGGCILVYATRRLYKVAVVLLVLIVQFLWWGWPRFGHGESYRWKERHDAHFAWVEHPSPATKAAADEEDKRLSTYIGRRESAFLVVVLVVDGVGIYYFWTYEARRAAA